jgi:hypothetical protein
MGKFNNHRSLSYQFKHYNNLRVTLFTIHLGSTTILTGDENRIILSTATYTVHPQYNQNTLENDVGLIKLHMPITFTGTYYYLLLPTTTTLSLA